MPNELQLFARWIYQRLLADASLNALVGGRIYEYVIPENAVYPCVVFIHQTGMDNNGGFGQRLFANETYQIKGVGEGPSFNDIGPISHRIDDIFQDVVDVNGPSYQTGYLIGTLYIMGVMRSQPYQYAEIGQAGRRYNHLGGFYKVSGYLLSE